MIKPDLRDPVTFGCMVFKRLIDKQIIVYGSPQHRHSNPKVCGDGAGNIA